MIAMPTVDPETELLIALRDRLREQCGLSEKDCDIEPDEMGPATQGHSYVIVVPGGMRTGQQHSPAGHTEDLIYGVHIIVAQRVGNVARDRLRNTFTTQSASINRRIRQVMLAVDDGYAITTAANLALEAGGGGGAFIEPLEFKDCDDKPRMVGAEMFGGTLGGGKDVMLKTVKFANARFMRKW